MPFWMELFSPNLPSYNGVDAENFMYEHLTMIFYLLMQMLGKSPVWDHLSNQVKIMICV